MTVKFTNPTDKYVSLLLGNKGGTLNTIFVYIDPYNYSIYEANGSIFARFFKEFSEDLVRFKIQHDRL